MRKLLALLVLTATLTAVAPVRAQSSTSVPFNFGTPPTSLNFYRIDQQAPIVRAQDQLPTYRLTNFFRNITLPSWPPRLGSSKYPKTEFAKKKT